MKFWLMLICTLTFIGAGMCVQADSNYTLEIEIVENDLNREFLCPEMATFQANLTTKNDKTIEGELIFTISNDGGVVLAEKRVEAKDQASMSWTLSQPGFLRCQVQWKVGDKLVDKKLASAAYEREKIVQAFPEPEDFDKFWQEGFEELSQIPEDLQITPFPELCDDEFEAFKVSMANLNGKRIYAVLTVPRAEGTFPGLIGVPGAGPARWEFNKFSNAINLFINVHEYEPSDDKEESIRRQEATYQTRYEFGNTYYACVGARDRKTFFSRDAMLGMSRMINVVRRHPKFNQKSIIMHGESQGGGAALALTALNPDITEMYANVANLCDHGGMLAGRSPGGPRVIRSAPAGAQGEMLQATAYCDAVNFSKRITCKATLFVAWLDLACSPSSVYAAYNALKSEDKQMLDYRRNGHGSPPEYRQMVGECVTATNLRDRE